VRVAYLAFIAFLAGLTFLVLAIADQERQAQAGVESIPVTRLRFARLSMPTAARRVQTAQIAVLNANRRRLLRPATAALPVDHHRRNIGFLQRHKLHFTPAPARSGIEPHSESDGT